ncbi:Golgi coiled coil protein GCC185, related [Neospora caninum Liverpool]|uniref:Golgi coiled coil protein GCC185, related n=1 Tax=Neospora caninum (strain Liverpool) TaxID=572307 RepID=F0VJS0_NEOCL|nr:Golgi coiled coil protein GCC185, related [Neospora caninum Liverpool]CBZ53981.1 Golgi coiled coil protein GCC185, related [Neospora caninum Liverpool]CEL67982.1 TPA: Golgi coiled coil protein GCC185, related [Neospora caninum Liverpool]|eukprot:XP_003884013.1 Golgi coiled coil protein GCC185, related [Neospora caninum Liverpool]
MMAAPNSFAFSDQQRFAWQANQAPPAAHPSSAATAFPQNAFSQSQQLRPRHTPNSSAGIPPQGVPVEGAGTQPVGALSRGEGMVGAPAVWSSPFGAVPRADSGTEALSATQNAGRIQPLGQVGRQDEGIGSVPEGSTDVQKAMMQMMFNTVADNLSTQAASQVSQLQKWFPSAIAVLRPYFSVSQTQVRQRLVQLLFPFLSLWRSAPAEGRALSTKDIDGESSQAALSALPRDLYTPLMALVTYVLLYALTRGAANDFRPELLGSTASVALLLLVAEVVVAKVAFYVTGAGVSTLDLFSFCGYKYVHLALLIAFRLFLNVLASVEVSPAAHSNATGAVGPAGLVDGTAELPEGDAAGIPSGTPDSLASSGGESGDGRGRGPGLLDGGGLWGIFTAVYVYLFACAAAELFVLLRGATTRCFQESEAAGGWQVSRDSSRQAGPKSVIFALALLQLPLCWLLTPSFSVVKQP